MSGPGLTPQEYELHVRDLRERLRSFLESGAGDMKVLLHDAESVMELAEQYPEVVRRHPDLEGLVAELLARREQRRFTSAGTGSQQERSGCLLGWLLGRRT